MKKGKRERTCGILLPIASLASAYGIGAFSKEAYDFVDFLAEAGQSWWQILPLGPTSYGDSPYQSFSTFAGNPYFIDLSALIREGYLTKKQADACDFGDDETSADYAKLYRERYRLLWKAYENAGLSENSPKGPKAALAREFGAFVRTEREWLEDYALFMALKDAHEGRAWETWEEPLRLRETAAMSRAAERHADRINFYRFLQYLFFRQWRALKSYANEKGVRIIGDLPIYVAFDSADTWSQPELFQLDENHLPTAVAGCPPDDYAKTGQLWGNPLYRWEYHEETDYAWWSRRIAHAYRLYDMVRIDHFRGFESYYSIPYGALTAERGAWRKGPGYRLFEAVRRRTGEHPMIAEDLGFLTPAVHRLVKRSGYPGMKVLQFAFDAKGESDYLPYRYERNCVVYTGTHDNDTTLGWYRSMPTGNREFARRYFDRRLTARNVSETLTRAALGSVADTAIIPLQDYLNLGAEARINIPSTIGCNWRWRMTGDMITKELAARLYTLAELYGRAQKRNDA